MPREDVTINFIGSDRISDKVTRIVANLSKLNQQIERLKRLTIQYPGAPRFQQQLEKALELRKQLIESLRWAKVSQARGEPTGVAEFFKRVDRITQQACKLRDTTDVLSSFFTKPSERASKAKPTLDSVAKTFGDFMETVERNKDILDKFYVKGWDKYFKNLDELREHHQKVTQDLLEHENRMFERLKRLREREAQQRALVARLQGLSRSFRRAAFNVVWSTLSILGVVWSLDAALRFSIDPLQRYVEQLSNWETIAFNVATWMAIAKREGLDISKLTGGKDTQEYLKELTDTAQLLKATFGSLDTVILMFLNNVINRTPDLKDKIVSTFQKIIDVLSRKDVIESMGNFIRGILTGIDTIIGKLPQLIQFFDRFLSVTMNALATAIKPLGSVIPGINELSDQIFKASSGFEKFGIVIGGLATIMPILAPILTFFQFLLSTIQLIIFHISLLFKGLGDIGGKLGRIRPLQKFFDKVKQKVVDAFLGGLGRVVRSEKLGRIFDTFKTKWVGKVVDFVKEGLKKFKADKKAMATLSDLVGVGVSRGIWKALKTIPSLIAAYFGSKLRGIGGYLAGGFTAMEAIGQTITVGLGGWIPYIANIVYRYLSGGRPQTVTVNQYVHIDKIEKEGDENRLVEKLYRQAVYGYRGYGVY